MSDEVAQQKSAIEDLEALTNRKAGMLVDTASGAIASFVPDSTIPDLLGVSVDIEPVQAGSGYPSPNNIRRISGWDTVNIWNKPTHDTTLPPTVEIRLGQTVYQAKLTINEDGSGQLLLDSVKCPMWTPQDSSQWQLRWGTSTEIGANTFSRYAQYTEAAYAQYAPGNSAVVISDCYKTMSNASEVGQNDMSICAGKKASYEGRLVVRDSRFTDPVELNQWLRNNEAYAVYKLRPEWWQTIPLTATQIATIAGQQNNVWADAGDVDVTFAADLKHYIDSKIAAAVAALS